MMGFMFSNSVLTTCPKPLPCNPHCHCSQEAGWCPSRCRKPPGTNISDWLTLNLTSPLNLWTPCDQCRSSEESRECEGRWPPFQSLGQSEGVLLHGVGPHGATFKESYWRWCLNRKEVELTGGHLQKYIDPNDPEQSQPHARVTPLCDLVLPYSLLSLSCFGIVWGQFDAGQKWTDCRGTLAWKLSHSYSCPGRILLEAIT